MHTQVPLTRITRAHTCAVLAAAPIWFDNNTHLTCLCPFLPVFCSPGGGKQAAVAGPPEARTLSECRPLPPEPPRTVTKCLSAPPSSSDVSVDEAKSILVCVVCVKVCVRSATVCVWSSTVRDMPLMCQMNYRAAHTLHTHTHAHLLHYAYTHRRPTPTTSHTFAQKNAKAKQNNIRKVRFPVSPAKGQRLGLKALSSQS